MAKKKDEEQGYGFKSGPVNYYDGTDSGADRTFLGGEDYGALQGYKDQWSAAREAGDQAGMDAAHAAAEALRAKYGYSGGANGGAYNVLDSGKGAAGSASGGGFSYGDAPSYTSKYQQQIDALAQGILGRDPFSYDAEKDPLYQQYRESYTREGQRAMQDTLGQVSARTGGLASSYAGTAAQQSYNNYMGALNDKIPELQQLAYSMYMDEGNRQRNNLNMLMGLDESGYGRYRDSVGDWRDRRDFGYGVYSDNWNRDYQAGRDAVNDRRYDREYADQRGDVAYGREQDKALTLAAAGSYAALAGLWGMDEEQTQALVDEYARQRNLTDAQAARDLADWHAQYGDFSKLKEQGVDTSFLSWQQGRAMAPAGGGGGGAETGSGVENDYHLESLFSKMKSSGNPYLYLSANRKNYNLDASAMEGVMEEYKAWERAQRAENAGVQGTDGYRAVLNELSRVEDMGISDGAKAGQWVDIIQRGYESGQINESEVKRLLAQYGLG